MFGEAGGGAAGFATAYKVFRHPRSGSDTQNGGTGGKGGTSDQDAEEGEPTNG